MMMHGPNTFLFLVSALLALYALLVTLGIKLPGTKPQAIWVALIAWALLAFGVNF